MIYIQRDDFMEVYNNHSDVIRALLKEIETEHKIKILFAIESGSRVWGIESPDSDYDIRFVFTRQLDDYISLNKKSDIIQKSYNEHGQVVNQEKCLYDIIGFDIHKFLSLLTSSNPTVIEWILSDIIYINDDSFLPILKKIVNDIYNPFSLYLHYRSMCKQNYEKYIKSGYSLTVKKYLYCLRSMLNALYIYDEKKLPPINFNKLIDITNNNMSTEGHDYLMKLLIDKKTSDEKNTLSRIDYMDKWIETFLKDINLEIECRKISLEHKELLNILMRNCIYGKK